MQMAGILISRSGCWASIGLVGTANNLISVCGETCYVNSVGSDYLVFTKWSLVGRIPPRERAFLFCRWVKSVRRPQWVRVAASRKTGCNSKEC